MLDTCNERPAALDTADAPAPGTEPAEVLLSARRSLTLRCGHSSLTLYADGRIVLHGESILSNAEGLNRNIVQWHITMVCSKTL